MRHRVTCSRGGGDGARALRAPVSGCGLRGPAPPKPLSLHDGQVPDQEIPAASRGFLRGQPAPGPEDFPVPCRYFVSLWSPFQAGAEPRVACAPPGPSPGLHITRGRSQPPTRALPPQTRPGTN